MDTDTFFEKLKKQEITITPVEMVFINANHAAEQVEKDFNNVFPYVLDNGLIFLHDTFPYEKEQTNCHSCGTAYQFASKLSSIKSLEYEIITIPMHPGLSIIRKRKKQVCWM